MTRLLIMLFWFYGPLLLQVCIKSEKIRNDNKTELTHRIYFFNQKVQIPLVQHD